MAALGQEDSEGCRGGDGCRGLQRMTAILLFHLAITHVPMGPICRSSDYLKRPTHLEIFTSVVQNPTDFDIYTQGKERFDQVIDFSDWAPTRRCIPRIPTPI